MRSKVVVLVGVLVLASTAFGASAFTSATIDRSATMDVKTDDKGLIALEDGTSGPLVHQKSSGALEIDLAESQTAGANINSTYKFGNPSDPVNQTAFNITNRGGETHDVSLEYVLNNADTGSSAQNVKYMVYDPDDSDPDTAEYTVTEEDSGPKTLTLTSGETYNVVVVIDTNSEVVTGDDLSGTLKVRV